MTTTSAPSDTPAVTFIRRSRGMSAVELMFSVTILALVVAVMLAAFVMFSKGAASVTDYSLMNMEGRRATDVISRDFRSASDVLAATQTSIRLELPAYVSENTVEYIFDEPAETLRRIEYDADGANVLEEVVMTKIRDFTFNYYDRLGSTLVAGESAFLASIKCVRLKATSTRNVSEMEVSNTVTTPRFMLRNRAPRIQSEVANSRAKGKK